MTRHIRLLFAVAVLFLFAAGCRHDDAQNVIPANITTPAAVNNGNWIITYFTDNGTDKASQYSAYSFQFNSDGTIVATANGTNASGSWKTGTDDSKAKFTITIAGGNSLLEEIAEDWIIKTNTATELDLTKSGGHPREIHFTKQ